MSRGRSTAYVITIQNLGYSAAAYDVAIARLIRKYGGKRRELTMRLEELGKFRVRMEMQMILNELQSYWIHLCSAVARGGAGGARAPPVFFPKNQTCIKC